MDSRTTSLVSHAVFAVGGGADSHVGSQSIDGGTEELGARHLDGR